jgi:hypothetical protein
VLRRIAAIHHDTEELTTLGRHLSALPMDPRVGKSLVFAVLLGCIEPVLTIVAILSHRPPFVMPLHKKQEADAAKQSFSCGFNSDHRAVLEAYAGWFREESRGRGAEFSRRNFLSGPALITARDLREQLRSLLVDVDLLPKHGRGEGADPNRHGHRWPVVVAALCAGLYPNVARADVGRGSFKKVRYFARENGKLEPHPGSVNSSGKGDWHHRWVVYFDKVKTATGLYIYDSTEVAPLPLLLFGAGDPKAGGRLLRCTPGGTALSPTESAAAKDELTRCQRRRDAMAESADRELLGDRIEMLEQQLAASGVGANPGGAHGDEAVDFVVRLLQANRGEYAMSRLSGFLKRSAPAHLTGQFFPIRRWLDAHADVFVNQKRGGPWIVSLVDGGGVTGPVVGAQGEDECVGVEDWIYFNTTVATATVVGGLRQAMAALLERRVLRLVVGREADLLVDALCDALDSSTDRRARPPEAGADRRDVEFGAQCRPQTDRYVPPAGRSHAKKPRGDDSNDHRGGRAASWQSTGGAGPAYGGDAAWGRGDSRHRRSDDGRDNRGDSGRMRGESPGGQRRHDGGGDRRREDSYPRDNRW